MVGESRPVLPGRTGVAQRVLALAMLETTFNFVLGPPSGGGSGLTFPIGNRGFWTDCGTDPGGTAAVITTRSAFKIEDPSLGPGRVDFRAPVEGYGLEVIPKPKIQRDPSPQKRKPYMWAALESVSRANFRRFMQRFSSRGRW